MVVLKDGEIVLDDSDQLPPPYFPTAEADPSANVSARSNIRQEFTQAHIGPRHDRNLSNTQPTPSLSETTLQTQSHYSPSVLTSNASTSSSSTGSPIAAESSPRPSFISSQPHSPASISAFPSSSSSLSFSDSRTTVVPYENGSYTYTVTTSAPLSPSDSSFVLPRTPSHSQSLPLPQSHSPSQSQWTSSTTTLQAVPSPVPPPPDTHTTSFAYVRRVNRVISGRYVLDPRFPQPPGAHADIDKARSEPLDDDVRLPTWEDDGNLNGGQQQQPGATIQPNLLLECKNGNIDAEVWVTGAAKAVDAEGKTIRARLDVLNKNGFILLKLNAAETSSPFTLRVHTKNGGLRLGIPRSFQGPLTTQTTNAWVNTSRPLAQASAVFSEVGGLRKSFVGDLLGSGYGNEDWRGSSIEIICEMGRVKLFYIDELEAKQQKKAQSKSWLGKLFSV